MTLELDEGPGVDTYLSSRFEVEIGSSSPVANYCYGKTRTTEYPVTGFWSAAASVEVSWSRFGTDAVQIVRVALADATPITSVVVFPRVVFDDRVEIQSGVAVISMPAHSKCRVEVNGERGEAIYIGADELADYDAPVGQSTVIYDATNVEAASDEMLVFEAGIHDLVDDGVWQAKLFPIRSNATVLLKRGAIVRGSFDLRTSSTTVATGVLIKGPGILMGDWITNEEVDLLPTFDDWHEHSMIFGYISGVGGSDNELRDITIIQSPFYTIGGSCLNRVYDTFILCPWTNNADGIKVFGGFGDDDYYDVRYNAVWAGDDAVDIHQFTRNGRLGNTDGAGGENLLSTAGGALVLFGYYATTLAYTFATTIGGNYYVPTTHYELEDDGDEYGAVFQCWLDGTSASSDVGRFNVSFTGDGYIECPDDDEIRVPIFNFGNKEYPWGPTLGRYGRMAGWTIKNLTVTKAPTELSRLYGRDWRNTPHDLHFSNIRIEGVLLTVRNWSAYVRTEEDGSSAFLYHITVGGRTLVTAVDICNSALSLVGERDRVTSIDPPDGSEEARHCSRAFTEAFEELQEMHSWGFTLRKLELTVVNEDTDDSDDPAWGYRYEIPEGMHEALAVLPDDSPTDYVLNGSPVTRDFHIKYSNTDEEQRIYTNEADAWLRYTVYVTDPNQCSRLFNTALTWLVASKIAGSIVRGDTGEAIKNRCLGMFGRYLAEAKVKDARQRQVDAKTTPQWLRGRTDPTTVHPFRVD